MTVLADADRLDLALLEESVPQVQRGAAKGVELTLLGALGCRLGMLDGGAGGFLVRMGNAMVLVDPGPAAIDRLARLAALQRFSFAWLDAIVCTHLHPDHTADLLPCLDGMLAVGTTRKPILVGNGTVVERFAALSPYHATRIDSRVLGPGVGGDPNRTTVAGVDIVATPARHLEEKADTGIGILLLSGADSLWYTSDTRRDTHILNAVADNTRNLTAIVANADASDIDRTPGREEACHLLTRDVLPIVASLVPGHVVIQHYDRAYSSARYRIAQAVYLQRLVNRAGLATRIWPGADGLHLLLSRNQGHWTRTYGTERDDRDIDGYLESTAVAS